MKANNVPVEYRISGGETELDIPSAPPETIYLDLTARRDFEVTGRLSLTIFLPIRQQPKSLLSLLFCVTFLLRLAGATIERIIDGNLKQ